MTSMTNILVGIFNFNFYRKGFAFLGLQIHAQQAGEARV